MSTAAAELFDRMTVLVAVVEAFASMLNPCVEVASDACSTSPSVTPGVETSNVCCEVVATEGGFHVAVEQE